VLHSQLLKEPSRTNDPTDTRILPTGKAADFTLDDENKAEIASSPEITEWQMEPSTHRH
jgi:hypothetical protein